MSGGELTRLRAEPDRERDLLAGPSGTLSDFRTHRTGFVDAQWCTFAVSDGLTTSPGTAPRSSPPLAPRARTCLGSTLQPTPRLKRKQERNTT
jgi:hypothetical protein